MHVGEKTRSDFASRQTGGRAASNCRRRGQVLIVVLVGMTLLVGLVFFVYNFGDTVNTRLHMQNAADSVAVSGANAMCRSMNTIAMNNVSQAKIIGTIPVLDALPMATEMAMNEVSAWEACLTAQLNRGVPDIGGRPLIRDGLTSIRDRFEAQRRILEAADSEFLHSGFRMEDLTHWSLGGGAGPQGTLWQAAVALDEMSQGVAANAGLIAQTDAVRFGSRNGADASFIVPVLPRLPARRGEFVDFRPVMEGRLHVTSDGSTYRPTGGNGGAIPDAQYLPEKGWPHRLGPWARILKWRDRTHRAVEREWVPPQSGARVRGGRGNVSIGGRRRGSTARTNQTGHGGYWRTTRSVETGYTTYGPVEWALRRASWYADGHRNQPGELRDTYFSTYLRSITRIKVQHMFQSKRTRTIHVPDWEPDYRRAVAIAAASSGAIKRSMYYLVEVASSLPEGSPNYLTGGTYRTNGNRPIAIWVNRWMDPETWNIERVGDYVWKDSYTYQVTEDPQLGIPPDRDPSGRPVWHTVYMTAYYIFGGVDHGTNEPVSDPANWTEGEVPPAPMLLDAGEDIGDYDPDVLDHDRGVRRTHFTFLGVVREGDTAPVWSQKFSTASPISSMVTVAQTQVFNNVSWDLWSQEWRCQLVPVSRWGDWTVRLEDGIDDAGYFSGQVRADELERMYEYFLNISPELADSYINH